MGRGKEHIQSIYKTKQNRLGKVHFKGYLWQEYMQFLVHGVGVSVCVCVRDTTSAAGKNGSVIIRIHPLG